MIRLKIAAGTSHPNSKFHIENTLDSRKQLRRERESEEDSPKTAGNLSV